MNKSRIEELFLQAEGSQDALKCLTNLLTSEASIIIAGSSEALRGVGFRKIIGSQSHQALRIIVADEQPEGMSDRWPLIRPTAELSRSVAMRAALSQDPDSVSVDVCNADSFAIYMASTETGHIGSITTLEAASAADAYKFMLECFTTRMPGKSREFATDYFAQTMPWILEVGEVAGKPTFSGLYRIRADGIEATFKLTQDKKPFYELSHEEIDPRTSWEIRREAEANKPFELSIQPREQNPPGNINVIAQIAKLYAPLARPTLVPVVTATPSQKQRSPRSQFGGGAWLIQGEAWPVCSCCKEPLLNVCQISGRDFDSELRKTIASRLPEPDELLQFFYCVSVNCDRNSWEPFSPGQLARRLPLNEKLHYVNAPEIPGLRNLGTVKTGTIEKWLHETEFPGWEERSCYGINFNDDEIYALDLLEASDFRRALLSPEIWSQFQTRMAQDLEYLGLNNLEDFETLRKQVKILNGDKFSGWPSWTQGVEYPNCPDCGQAMEFLLQISANSEANPPSEVHFPLLFAADGTGQLYHCPRHRERMTFTWACG